MSRVQAGCLINGTLDSPFISLLRKAPNLIRTKINFVGELHNLERNTRSVSSMFKDPDLDTILTGAGVDLVGRSDPEPWKGARALCGVSAGGVKVDNEYRPCIIVSGCQCRAIVDEAEVGWFAALWTRLQDRQTAGGKVQRKSVNGPSGYPIRCIYRWWLGI